MVHTAAEWLRKIKTDSAHGEYYAEHMREDLAKAYSNGEHKPVFRKLKDGEEYTATEKNAHANASRGTTISGCIDDFANCGHAWRHLANGLNDDAPREGDFGQIFNAYDTCLDAYWRLLRTLRDAFKEKKGLIPYIGSEFHNLYIHNLSSFEAASGRLIPILSTKHDGEKLKEWTVKTQKYLRQGREYCQGKQPDPNDLM